ncbi:hypothetical protein, partial [Paenibacillus sp. YAF4_2]|uniref:hypothetical protein n=1 Tax=Paenibacillus sp. YAF4_2 TaxID=3233085 RepID=UPI003F9B5800
RTLHIRFGYPVLLIGHVCTSFMLNNGKHYVYHCSDKLCSFRWVFDICRSIMLTVNNFLMSWFVEPKATDMKKRTQ